MRKFFVSGDAHVVEPPEVWDRLDPAYEDRKPYVVWDEPRQGWFFRIADIIDRRIGSWWEVGEEDKISVGTQGFADTERKGAFDPVHRLEASLQDHVVSEVLYPSLGMSLYQLTDMGFQAACLRAYNDWLAEFCATAPDRLIGVGMLCLADPAAAAAEAARVRDLGLRSVMVWDSQPEEYPLLAPGMDRFWAAISDLDMPVAFHAASGASRRDALVHKQVDPTWGSGVIDPGPHIYMTLAGQDVQRTLVELLWSGMLERYPNVKLVGVESDMGWAPFMLEWMDLTAERYRGRYDPPIQSQPSELWNERIWLSYITDAVGLRNLDVLNPERLMWSNDYPHGVSTWPHSAEVIQKETAHLPEDIVDKLVRTNAAKLYNIDLDKLQGLLPDSV